MQNTLQLMRWAGDENGTETESLDLRQDSKVQWSLQRRKCTAKDRTVSAKSTNVVLQGTANTEDKLEKHIKVTMEVMWDAYTYQLGPVRGQSSMSSSIEG